MLPSAQEPKSNPRQIPMIGATLGLDAVGSVLLVVVVLALMAVFDVALGMVFGSLLTVAQVSGAYAVVLLLTIFGGAWFNLEDIGGVFLTIGNALPFKHALDASRAVLANGAGVGDIGTDLVWVAGYALGASALAVFSFQRRMLE